MQTGRFSSPSRSTKTPETEAIRTRVVSMPSWELFDQQPTGYKASVLPGDITARAFIEQASTLGGERHVGREGQMIGMRTFGASASLQDLPKKFGFQPEAIVSGAKELTRRH